MVNDLVRINDPAKDDDQEFVLELLVTPPSDPKNLPRVKELIMDYYRTLNRLHVLHGGAGFELIDEEQKTDA